MAQAEGTALRKNESGSDRQPKAINRLREVQWIRREKTGFWCGWYRTELSGTVPSTQEVGEGRGGELLHTTHQERIYEVTTIPSYDYC